MMVEVFASNHALNPSDMVPGMPIEYVYRIDYETAVENFREKSTRLKHRIAVLQRVITRQDAMLVAKEEILDTVATIEGHNVR